MFHAAHRWWGMMLRLFSFVVVLTMVGTGLSAPAKKAAARQANTDDMWVVEPAADSLPPNVTHHTYISAAMNQRPVGYCVYLPPSYSQTPDQRYPVIYHLHGAGGNETRSVYSAQ